MKKKNDPIGAYEYFHEQHGLGQDFVDKLLDMPLPVSDIPDMPPPDLYPDNTVSVPPVQADPDSATSSQASPSHSNR